MHVDPLAVSKEKFKRVHNRVAMQDLLGRLRGEPTYLLPFGQVLEKLRLSSPSYRGLEEVPLLKIVGSLSRYGDFTRAFLPRSYMLEERWATVDRLRAEKELPPVELYAVGDTFFVSDGHHRISVARQDRVKTITAHVWAYYTRVPLEPETTLDDLLIKAEYLEFLENTQLDVSRPEQHIELTAPGGYRQMEYQIAAYQKVLSHIDGQPFNYREAATYWYDMIYTPILQIICETDMLRDFPGRTEADLIVWVASHQRELSMAFGYSVPMVEATDHLRAQRGVKGRRRMISAVRERLLGKRRRRRSSCSLE